MPIKINYIKSINKNWSNLVFFTNEKFNINAIKNKFTNLEFKYINELLKNIDKNKNYYFLILIQKNYLSRNQR